MLTTITTVSQSLDTILTAAQITQAGTAAKNTNLFRDGKYSVIIQNLGSQDIYLEFGGDASITGGIKITQNNSFTFSDVVLSNTYLISDISDNTDTRISAN